MFIAADLEELHNTMAEDAKQKLDYHTSTNSSTSAESKSKRAPTKKVEKEQGAVNATRLSRQRGHYLLFPDGEFPNVLEGLSELS